MAVGPAAQQTDEAYDLYWNSPKAVPVEALLDKPPPPEALTEMREELERNLGDVLDKMPYRVPLKDHELQEVLPSLAEELS